MEQHNISYRLQIIAFELTTPLVSLSGFYNLAKNRTKSQSSLRHLRSIMDSVEKILGEKDMIIEKTRTETDSDFSTTMKAVEYLHKMASKLQMYERLITSSVNQLVDTKWEDDDPNFGEWASSISTKAAKNLSEKIEALRNIKPDLEMVIHESRGT